MKVLVAMSGGVDSSVAAARLQEEGYDVIGATMQLRPRHGQEDSAIADARQVARRLGIAHYVMDLRGIFEEKVIADFCREYRRGRTPNPCVRCNQYLKFGALRERAAEMGADFIATGHHARVERDGAGRHLLKKGSDKHKDQSYFLYTLTQEQLKHTLFPIGHLTKDRVRAIASRLALPVASRPESREICFVPADGYPAFLRGGLPQAAEPGPILNKQGKVLGRHQGIMFYTIGQRRGLGIAAGEPLYVTAIKPERNAIIVGPKEAVYGTELVAADVRWILDCPEFPIKVKARVRYRHPEASAVLAPADDGRICVKFAELQMAITPGQAVVFYDGDAVLGGGTICWP
jgi:tRNA-specific 2-thiouridylase